MINKQHQQKAIQIWGKEKQLDMVIEECAELIVSINHYRRNRIDHKDVLSECIDVEMMINQLKLILEHNKDYERIREQKENRFIKRLLKATQEKIYPSEE